MSHSLLNVTIRTPRESIVEEQFSSMRVPTGTGQVGLRSRCEPTVLAVEPGLILLRKNGTLRYAGSSGGLLHTDGINAVLLTPLAVIGDDVQSVLSQLDDLLSTSTEEVELRAKLGRLESQILHELQQDGDQGAKRKGS